MSAARHHRRNTVRRQPSSKLGLGLAGRLILLTLGIVGCLFMLVAVLYYGSLRWFSQSNGPKRFLFVSSTLEDKINPSIFLILDPAAKKAEVIKLDSTIKMNMLGGYGEYELRAAAPLLVMEKKSAKYLQASFIVGLEQGMDGVLMVPNLAAVNNKGELIGVIGRTRNWWQRWQLLAFIWSLPDGRITWKEVGTWDAWRAWQAEQQDLKEPDCSVAVVNTTTTPKLANTVSTALNRVGVRVVRTTSENQSRETSQVLVASEQVCPYTLQQAEYILPHSQPVAVDEQLESKYRASLVFLIGEDLIVDLKKP